MKEIIFRGKRVDNDEWIEGSFISPKKLNTSCCIHNDTELPFYKGVIPETVGQFTGLTDKNGKKIFEGDIIKYSFKYGENREKAINENLIVKWCNKSLSYQFSKSKWLASFETRLKNDYEIIGNIHDNPELLEVK